MYNIFVTSETAKRLGIWFKPSEIDPRFNDTEPTLDHAIKAMRFYERSCGYIAKREIA